MFLSNNLPCQFKYVGCSQQECNGITTGFEYYRDIYTNVMYVSLRERVSATLRSTGFTPILGADGAPMLYDEWVQMEIQLGGR